MIFIKSLSRSDIPVLTIENLLTRRVMIKDLTRSQMARSRGEYLKAAIAMTKPMYIFIYREQTMSQAFALIVGSKYVLAHIVAAYSKLKGAVLISFLRLKRRSF